MPAARLEIALRSGVPDARGHSVREQARRLLHLPLRACRTREVYLIDFTLTAAERRALRAAFTDPVTARAAYDRLPPPPCDWVLEIGFKPGVTDNVGRTARALTADVLDRQPAPGEEVFTATQYFLSGPGLERDQVRRLASEVLANPLIQTLRCWTRAEWLAAPVDHTPPRFTETPEITARTMPLDGGDAALERISAEGILSLSLVEMHAIRDHYLDAARRASRAAVGLPPWPTDVELECLAQSWSEHCCHKIFAARVRYTDPDGQTALIDSLFKTYIQGATRAAQRDWLVSVFTDNAGIVRFNDHLYLTYKCETHNSPSALDPYGGAITGIVGVNRDPLGTGLGSALLCNTWGYCLGSPFYDGDLPAGLMHPRRIRSGVHQGVIDGGNQSGIPYARGFERFDDRFIGKPLVFCGTVGWMPPVIAGRPAEEKRICPGDRVVMIGGRIGKDGIHGATFSSEELRQESPAQAVQIGDPITQRMLTEFLLEARDLGLYRALTDNGAGGLSSSAGEMARLSGGLDLDLTDAPLKYPGLQPWEILLSEAQERMTLAVPPETLAAFLALARRRDVEASVLGSFTDSGRIDVWHGGKLVGRLELDFLHGGCPRLELEACWQPPVIVPPPPARRGNRTAALRGLLGALNRCSGEYKSRAYDHEVKGRSVIKPYVGVQADIPSDATVLLAEYDGREGLVLAEGLNPFYSDLDTYHMAASVMDEAVRRILAAGGRLDWIAGLDNFCWPDPVAGPKTPDGAHKLAQLVRANQALYDLCQAYNVPLISGKDSMKNDSVRGGRKISIPPTLLFSALGKIDDVGRALTLGFFEPGDVIYLLGVTRAELGASEYSRWRAAQAGRPGDYGGPPPRVYPEEALPLYRALAAATAQSLLRSAHTPTLGGLAAAAALCALAGNCGAELDFAAAPGADALPDAAAGDDALLFSESNSRFLVTCAPARAAALEAHFANLPCARLGTVADTPALTLRRGPRLLVQTPLEPLRKAFKKTLANI